MARIGIWIIGARGGLATTLIAGTHLMAAGRATRTGMVTDLPAFAGLPLFEPGDVVFGGHDIRDGDVHLSALEIARANGSIPAEGLRAVDEQLAAAEAHIRPGTAFQGGPAIREFVGRSVKSRETPKAAVARLRRDIVEFKTSERLDRVVVVNLASTEPPPDAEPPRDAAGLLKALSTGRGLRAGSLYAAAAIAEGCPWINFTPSVSAMNDAVVDYARREGVPTAGSDGKTGETLVKSALAPMFAHRALRVLSWQGYNILGDRDGLVLSDPAHKASKVKSKDAVLRSVLGYAPHTHVGIDYVPSLGDNKTAWDFIHFEGFLGHRMSMQFTWQGCDAVLAAPLVLDLCRLVDAAAVAGLSGPLPDLGFFFKSPIGSEEHDLHVQWERLTAFAGRLRPAPKRVARRRR